MVSIVIGNIMMGISILMNVITMQQKDKKNILIGLTFVNLTAIICYWFLKSYSAVQEVVQQQVYFYQVLNGLLL